MKRPSRSFEIVLSAIACAVVALALTLASYVNFLMAAGYLLAVFALMVPLSKDFIWGEVLAFLGGVLLAFFFGALAFFWQLLPFAVFFGLHPLINYLQLRFTKKKPLHALWFLLKALWFDGAMLLMWFTLGGVLGITEAVWYDWVKSYLYLVIFLGGTIFFAVYDVLMFLCQKSVNAIVRRIKR